MHWKVAPAAGWATNLIFGVRSVPFGLGAFVITVCGGPRQGPSVGVVALARGVGAASGAKSAALSPVSSTNSSRVEHPAAIDRSSDDPSGIAPSGVPAHAGAPVIVPQATQSMVPKLDEMKRTAPPAGDMSPVV